MHILFPEIVEDIFVLTGLQVVLYVLGLKPQFLCENRKGCNYSILDYIHTYIHNNIIGNNRIDYKPEVRYVALHKGLHYQHVIWSETSDFANS